MTAIHWFGYSGWLLPVAEWQAVRYTESVRTNTIEHESVAKLFCSDIYYSLNRGIIKICSKMELAKTPDSDIVRRFLFYSQGTWSRKTTRSRKGVGEYGP